VKAVSNVWETRNRLLWEQLEQMNKKLSSAEPAEPAELKELAVRLLASVVMLLRQHNTNKRGQCSYCAWTRRARPFWNRQTDCTVFETVDFAFRQRLDKVRRQLLTREP
jgi:hypothetical protein